VSTAQVSGITIGYDDEGEGPALLLVHGHPFDRSMWRPQTGEFARAGWRVIAPDLRGFGESTVSEALGWDVFARDLVALLDLLGAGEAVIAGLSMGGQIAMEFCRLFPGRVRGVVLAATFATGETAGGRRRRADLAGRLLRDGMHDYATEVLPKMMSPASIGAMPAAAAHVLAMMRGAPPAGAAAALLARAERPDYAGVLAGLTVPTLIVVGTEDAFTPVSDAGYMHGLIPGAELVIIRGSGHLPNLERPAEFSQALRRFLAGLGSGPGPAAAGHGARTDDDDGE
jgi:pimeloyl-ACP methyl ester carboxylesterase